jgi:hypothetical protein
MKKEKKIKKSFYLSALEAWLDKNGHAGWDPYDVWDHSFGLWASKRQSLLQKIIAVAFTKITNQFPNLSRRLLKTKKKINPKAMGLFAYSYILLAHHHKDNILLSEKYREKTKVCIDWLLKNAVKDFGGMGWGYPFDWQSRVLIPKNTPTIVNSSIIGDAFWMDYKLNGNSESLEVCKKICNFFVKGLNQKKMPNDSICLSYTPVDTFEVHNANLLGANFLIRIGTHCNNDEYISLGLACINFSTQDIMEDGMLPYWSVSQCGKNIQQDIYHSGFEIRSLLEASLLINDVELQSKVKKFYDAWKKKYIREGCPYMNHDSRFVEIHSCAESLITLSMVNKYGLDNNLNDINNCFKATVKNLWHSTSDDSGYFMSFHDLDKNKYQNIAYIRWGEAWMLRALVEILTLKRNS